jgi:hypothetical protein
MSRVAMALLAAVNVLISGGCATTPAAPLALQEAPDQSRVNSRLEPDVAVCSAAYTEAFERAKGDIPADPVPAPSGSAMAMQAAATVNVWRSIANDAFNSCMRSNKNQRPGG